VSEWLDKTAHAEVAELASEVKGILKEVRK